MVSWFLPRVAKFKGHRLYARLTLLTTLACTAHGGAGSDAAPGAIFDADPSDAAAQGCLWSECEGECVDTSRDPDHCGACFTHCVICTESSCACPDNFLPDTLEPTESQAFSNSPPAVRVFAIFQGLDGMSHSLGVTFDASNISLDTEIDLSSANAPVEITVRYAREGNLSRARFGISSGTLTVERACAEGVTGRLVGASLFESTGGPTPAPVADGCILQKVTTQFDLGEPCADLDAGAADAGAVDPDAGSGG